MKIFLQSSTCGHPNGNRPRAGAGGTLRRLLATAALGLLGTGAAHAQALNYDVSGAVNTTSTYAALGTTGTVITTADFDDSNSAAQNIGFSFSFNGAAFTQFVLSTNGFIKLGSAAPSATTMYAPLASANALDVNIIAPLANDLVGSTTVTPEYRVATTGTSPNQVCTIQWQGVRDYNATSSQFASEQFQVKLYEGSNRVEFVYGTWTPGPAAAAGRNHEVGIKGTTNATTDRVQASRGSLTAWSGALFAAGAASFFVRNTVLPDAGRTFRFNPKPANDVAVAAIYTMGQLPIPSATPHTVRAVFTNSGAAATTSRTATLAVTGANTFSDVQTVPALAVGASATLTFASYSPTVAGTNAVAVSVPADDVTSNNLQTLNQEANSTGLFGYVSSPVVPAGFASVGSTGPISLGVRYTTTTARTVTAVKLYVTVAGTITASLYDVAGNVLGSSAATAVTAGSLQTLTLTSPVVIGAGSFMVGGLLSANTRIGFQPETPTRAGISFQINAGPALLDLASSNLGKPYVEAVTSDPPACSSVTSLQTPSLAAGTLTATTAQLVFGAGGGVVDYTVTYTPAGGTATTVTPSQSASPVTISGLTPNTAYTATIQTNCGGTNSGTPLSVTFTTPFANDLAIVAVYSAGQLPLTYGSPHAVQALVRNLGSSAQTGTVVTLNVTGTSTATLTQTVTLAAGASTVVTFAGYVLSANGANTVTVTAPADDNAANNSGTYAQNVSADRLSYIAGTTLAAGGVGVGSANGFLAAKYTLPTPAGATIASVTPSFVANASASTTYRVVLLDATGAGGTPGTAFYTSPIQTRTSAAASPVIAIPNAAVPASGVFYIALQELDNNLGLGNQAEVPLRSGTFYFRTTGAWTDVNTTTLTTRLALEASIVALPACLPISSLTATPATTSATLNFTPSTSGVADYSVVVTPAGGSALPTQTVSGSPATVTGLSSGTTYTAVVTTNCTGGNGSSTPVSVTFTTGPANDECSGAIALTVGAPGAACNAISGSTIGATTSTAAGTCVGTADDDVWYSFVATNASHTITVAGASGFDAVVNLRAGACPGTTVGTCQDDTGSGGTETIAATGLTVGATYSVRVFHYFGGSGSGNFTICVTTPAPPPCNAPTALATNTITTTSANVTFTASASATSYVVTYTPAGGTATTVSPNPTASPVALTGLTPATAYTVSIVSNCAAGATSSPVTTSFTTTTPAPQNLTVTSGQNVTATGPYNNITVQNGGTLTLSGATSATGAVQVQAGGLLITNCQALTGSGSFALQTGAELRICDPAGIAATGATGAIQLAGTRTFAPDASYTYNGTAAQVTGSGLPASVRNLTVNNATGLTLSQGVSIGQVARLQSGNLSTGGQSFTLLSSATGTALVDNTGGVVTGTGTMQRAVTNAVSGPAYRHFSSPVASTTLADLSTAGFSPTFNPAYNSSATPSLVTPFPTVFGYDQNRVGTVTSTYGPFDKGWFSPASASDVMQPTRGYTVNAPATATPIDFVGTFNNAAQNSGSLGRGTDAQAGWQLLGNPYPSPLDWSTVTTAQRPGMDGAMYVYQSTGQYAGTYRTYDNGVGGSPLIVAGSGYFARVSTPSSTGSVNLTNINRITAFGAEPTFGRGTADTRPQLHLQLTGAGLTDETFLYQEAGATAGVDAQYDAVKLANPAGLDLASLNGTTQLAINGLPLPGTADVVVPLALRVPQGGSFGFDVAGLTNFGTATVYLRDALTGTQQLLLPGTRYSFTLATATAGSGRFSVVFRAANVTATRAGLTAATVSVYPNPAHGHFTVLLPPLAGQHQVQATLLNVLGQVVLTRIIGLTAAGATADFSTQPLAKGVYMLRLQAENQVLSKSVVVE